MSSYILDGNVLAGPMALGSVAGMTAGCGIKLQNLRFDLAAASISRRAYAAGRSPYSIREPPVRDAGGSQYRANCQRSALR